MDSLIEQLIADYHERTLPQLAKRNIDIPCLKGNIDMVIGMRRTGKTFLLFQIRFRDYLVTGGFPEIQNVASDYRYRILQEYVDVVILRDVIERYQIGNIIPLRMLVRHLLNSPATLFSINKFYNDLKSQGIACGKNTLHEFFKYLTDAYLIYPVSIHSRSERAKRVNARKIYVIDTGLIYAYKNHPGSDLEQVLENFVFIQLRRKGQQIDYYRTKSGYEVDFITTAQDKVDPIVKTTQ